MPDKPPPTPTPVLDHRTARDNARNRTQHEQREAAVVARLIDNFHAVVMKRALTVEGSPLATLTITQLNELLVCLGEAITMPPPLEDD